MIVINLETWEYERAADVGIRRYTANWGRENAPWYDPERMEDDRTASVAAAISELAVAKYLNRYWHGHVWHASEHDKYDMYPDVGLNTEVRRLRVSQGVPIRKKQNLLEDLVVWAAFPVPREFRQVQILGWIRQQVGWEFGLPAKYDAETTRLFPVDKLNPPTQKVTKETKIVHVGAAV